MAVDHDTIVRVLLRDRTRLLAYTLAIVRDEHVAEDILQEVSLAALRKRGQIQGESHLLLWLRHAARFSALESLRRRQNQPRALDANVLDALESHWDALDQTATTDAADALRHCLSKVTPYGRQLLELRYGEGLDGATLAKRLGRNLHTIYIALSRTRKQLADCVRNRVREASP